MCFVLLFPRYFFRAIISALFPAIISALFLLIVNSELFLSCPILCMIGIFERWNCLQDSEESEDTLAPLLSNVLGRSRHGEIPEPPNCLYIIGMFLRKNNHYSGNTRTEIHVADIAQDRRLVKHFIERLLVLHKFSKKRVTFWWV